jgi:hypothetical protein
VRAAATTRLLIIGIVPVERPPRLVSQNLSEPRMNCLKHGGGESYSDVIIRGARGGRLLLLLVAPPAKSLIALYFCPLGISPTCPRLARGNGKKGLSETRNEGFWRYLDSPVSGRGIVFLLAPWAPSAEIGSLGEGLATTYAWSGYSLYADRPMVDPVVAGRLSR